MPGKHYNDVIDMDEMFGKDVLDMDSMLGGRKDILGSKTLVRRLNKKIKRMPGGTNWEDRANRLIYIKKGYSAKHGGWTSRAARKTLSRGKIGPKARREREQAMRRSVRELIKRGAFR